MIDNVSLAELKPFGKDRGAVIRIFAPVNVQDRLPDHRCEGKVRWLTTAAMHQSCIALIEEPALDTIKLPFGDRHFCCCFLRGQQPTKMLLENCKGLSLFCVHAQGSGHLRGSAVDKASM